MIARWFAIDCIDANDICGVRAPNEDAFVSWAHASSAFNVCAFACVGRRDEEPASPGGWVRRAVR